MKINKYSILFRIGSAPHWQLLRITQSQNIKDADYLAMKFALMNDKYFAEIGSVKRWASEVIVGTITSKPFLVELTDFQKKVLNRLWFIYGNKGTFHTVGNHKIIQNLLEKGIYEPHYAKLKTEKATHKLCNMIFDLIRDETLFDEKTLKHISEQ